MCEVRCSYCLLRQRFPPSGTKETSIDIDMHLNRQYDTSHLQKASKKDMGKSTIFANRAILVKESEKRLLMILSRKLNFNDDVPIKIVWTDDIIHSTCA